MTNKQDSQNPDFKIQATETDSITQTNNSSESNDNQNDLNSEFINSEEVGSETIQSINNASKKKQQLIFGATSAVIAVILGTFIFSSPKKKSSNNISDIINSSKDKIILHNPNDYLRAEDRLVQMTQGKLETYDNFMKASESNKSSLEKRLEDSERTNEEIKVLIEQQSKEIEDLKKSKSKTPDQNSNPNNFNPSNNSYNSYNQSNMMQSQGLNAGQPMVGISSIDIPLEESVKPTKHSFFDAKEYVPAGAYASAIIISGVDASVGISSQSDPRPVLIRVTGPAVSSIYEGNVQKADLNGCIITGAASGDLSSEKIYVKLVKLTCGKEEDQISEIEVKGYVAGQGRSGVRGNVISREGDLLTKSFLAGLVGGFGSALSEKVAPPLSFAGATTIQGQMTSSDIAKSGLGKGISNSASYTEKYLTDRMEQYQPVVSIPNGINVEVVFVEGFYVNGEKGKETKK